MTILAENKAVVCAITASYISTFAGYPVCTYYSAGDEFILILQRLILVGLPQVETPSFA